MKKQEKKPNLHVSNNLLLCSALTSDSVACVQARRASLKQPVTLQREVMKWSNYGSIYAIQMKPGVKFPICAPAVLSIQRALTSLLPASR